MIGTEKVVPRDSTKDSFFRLTVAARTIGHVHFSYIVFIPPSINICFRRNAPVPKLDVNYYRASPPDEDTLLRFTGKVWDSKEGDRFGVHHHSLVAPFQLAPDPTWTAKVIDRSIIMVQ